MAETFTTRRRVEFADTDMAGIAHFSAFFRYMEAAEHALFRSLGLSIYDRRQGRHLSFPRVSAACDYQSPARCEEELDFCVTIAKLGRTSIGYRFRITRDGAPVAEGRMTSVCCHVEPDKPLRPTAIPEDIAALLRPFVEP
ncbi:1,4-dihydroxy-2-naphthoyl-CoA hydrolase [Pirellulimonas nuda]|uniref:1,4-dihydroxy-2-naphthoyl-CoA hydrolase n=1 Tax=Pirellulimonas nuda TaxID=2528009 RepID=A0A518DA20_9BACT|nr:thioesterase family protein [Pirellulimonas nuda]QDU88293.1 1,4-dihydroxy-2-naphthoyl-CoA hydrolase [Pirellulimonas nuda]